MEPAMPRLSNLPTLLATTAALIGAVVTLGAPPANAAQAAQAAQAAEGCATVEVQHVRPQQGQLMLAAFASADTYRKKPLVQMQLAAGDATMRFAVCGLGAAQELALTLFQDLDGDGRMGSNLIGMPTEPWGSSGSPGTFGPTWDTGRVKLDGSVIVVKMSQ
jgi:uncharacterized protein (DUF2141 family)